MNENNKTEQDDRRLLEVYLAEYKHLSSSILASEDGRRQMVNITTAVIAASVSAVTIFQNQPILYLFGALLLSLLTWIMVEETARTGIHNRYLRFVLGPKIEELLNVQNKPVLGYTVFAFDVNPSTTVATVLAPAKYIIGLGISALFFALFLVEKNSSNLAWSEIETILFYANIVSFSAPVLLGIVSIAALSLKEIKESFVKNILKKNVGAQSKNSKSPERHRVSGKVRRKDS
jgi:hypothetical protein